MYSTRPISLRQMGMSREAYRELEYFCLQYAQKRREAAQLLGAKGEAGRRRARLLRDVDIIEGAARAAAEDLAPYLLRAVTERAGVQSVFARTRPPVGERQFYNLRKRFFVELKRRRENGSMECSSFEV